MTVNERLFLSGRMDEFDKLVRAKDVNGLKALLKDVEITDESSMRAIIESLGLEYMPRQKETRHAKRNWITILLLFVPLCLVVLLATLSNCLSNFWMLLIEPNYIIPKESNIFQFEVNQMNEGSGDWWIYGQDNKNYYYFLGSDFLPYITFSKGDTQTCSGFDKLNINTWCDKIVEVFKAKDTTVTYAELLDNGYGAILYRPIYPDVLFFVELSDSSLYEVDSIVDFNHDFTVYRTEAELIKEMGNFTAKDINKMDFKKLADYKLNRKNYLRNHFHKPTMGRFAGDLFMLDDGGVYKLSLSKRIFDKVIYYSIALDIPDSCDDNILRKPYPNPQKSISSSVIKVSFDDGSFFELAPNGSLNIQVVDRNTCLIIESDFNNEHVKYKEGKKCDKAFVICE